MVGYISLPLATVMGFGRRESSNNSAEATGDTGFGDHLAETIAESIQRANQGGRPVQITVSERQNAATEPGSRQFIITVNPPGDAAAPAGGARTSERGNAAGSSNGSRTAPSSSPGTSTSNATATSPATAAVSAPRPPLETDWNPPLRSATSGSVFDMENPIPKVQDLLVKMGINPAEVKFELVDDVINNLGGSYVNHLMRVNMPNGWKEDFAVEYILRNPSITANEIAALNRLPAAPPHLRGV